MFLAIPFVLYCKARADSAGVGNGFSGESFVEEDIGAGDQGESDEHGGNKYWRVARGKAAKGSSQEVKRQTGVYPFFEPGIFWQQKCKDAQEFCRSEEG
jgi:hypothetical protein